MEYLFSPLTSYTLLPLRGISPQGETRTLRDWLSVSYGMISTLVIGSLRSPPPYPAVPDFPLCRGQNKTPRDNLLINPPLEMTVAAGPPIVISTAAERSGEISFL